MEQENKNPGIQRSFFESKIRPVLLYTGSIVAGIMAIAYVFAVLVLIEGFAATALLNTTIFSVVTAFIGFCIMQMLKIQGQAFAENLPENQAVKQLYLARKDKTIKYRSLKYYWVTSVISDVLTRCLTLAATSIGVIYLVIEGSKNFNLLFLALVNLLMFAGFGLVSLVNAYDFYNESYVPFMQNKIREDQEQNETNKQNQSDSVKDMGISQSDLSENQINNPQTGETN